MILTPLYILALDWNQWVTDHLFPYRQPIYWDRNSRQFGHESRRRHRWPWCFAIYVIYGGILFPCLLVFFLQTLSNPDGTSMIQILAAVIQWCCGVETVASGVAHLRWAVDVIAFLNQFVKFEKRLQSKFDKHSVYQEAKRTGKFPPIRLPSGKIDHQRNPGYSDVLHNSILSALDKPMA